MAVDVIFLSELVRELAGVLDGGKIEKVNQPSRSELILTVKAGGERRDLYIGGIGSGGRICLTEREYDRPSEPPMFCMLLRKHLVGARITSITQTEGERIVELSLDAPGMLGEGEKRGLIIELFGRNANAILTDGDGIITDCLYRSGGAMEDRAILPGMKYRYPDNPHPIPQTSKLLEDFLKSGLNSPSAFIDGYYGEKAEEERRRRRTGDLVKRVRTLRDRTERRVEAQREELLEAGKRDYYRECGDIITTNIHAMKKGDRVLKAFDYYSENGSEREISLDPLKTPQENAAWYYKSYTKLKNAVTHLTREIEKGEREVYYLDSVLDELSRASTLREAMAIREELEAAGVIRSGGGKKKELGRREGPMRFISSTGTLIRVGRNNLENDRLTLKDSAATDVWLHAQKIHGSHAVISCAGSQPDEATLSEAASLAAWFSQGRDSGKVPVDYALVKHVKKPSGARPGMVIYTNYRTVIARPDGELCERLRQK